MAELALPMERGRLKVFAAPGNAAVLAMELALLKEPEQLKVPAVQESARALALELDRRLGV